MQAFVVLLLAACAVAQVQEAQPESTDRPTVPSKIDFHQLPLYLQEIIGQSQGRNPFGPNPNNPSGHGFSSFGMMGWPGVPGKPGVNGHNGMPGPVGPAGPMGPTGIKGDPGPAGSSGAPGRTGMVGMPGLRGERGLPGPAGADGMPGFAGRRGLPGMPGRHGHALWKQCAWQDENDLDNGIIKNCSFTKQQRSTSLRVAFSGNLRVGGCEQCCSRWFFTFNNRECAQPVPIDAAIYNAGPAYRNPLRPRFIEGYCDRVERGPVVVALNVAPCSGYTAGNAYTGWNSASRIIIEEVSAPQP